MFSLLRNSQIPSPPPMAPPPLFELKLKIISAKDLKNVKGHQGSLKPSVSAWVEPNAIYSTKVDHDGDTSPTWNHTLHIPVPSIDDDSALYLDIVHDKSNIVGSATLSLREVVDDVGFGVEAFRSLELRRPSGRLQGKIDVEVSVKELQNLLDHNAAPYSVAPSGRYCMRFPDEKESDAGTETVLYVAEVAGAFDRLAIPERLDHLKDDIAKKVGEEV